MAKKENRVGLLEFYPESRREAKYKRRVAKKLHSEMAHQLAAVEKIDFEAGFPAREWGAGGENRPRSGRGLTDLKVNGVPTTAHTAATAFPWVAGPSLGSNGVLIGRDLHGGGAFCFDPWEQYAQRTISGMSMMLFGTVGMGKSSLAKCLAIRLVLLGRKLSVASDKKGEWTQVVHALGGSVIQIGPGLDARLNPLDPGVRPSLDQRGKPMSDAAWAKRVRSRRSRIITTMLRILLVRDLTPEEHAVVSTALDRAVGLATEEKRVPTLVDIREALEHGKHDDQLDDSLQNASGLMEVTLRRIDSGDLEGMFNGETTESFDENAPAVSIDTSSLSGAAPEALRIVNACAGSWMESMVTTSDSGQRIVVYEEGWDNVSSEADLQRMVEGWKLARAYGIFNVLILHKIKDLDMAGDQGSRMAAMARSLLADADVKVIYRQDSSALASTASEIELTEREEALLKTLPKGAGLWRVGSRTFEVLNELTPAEKPLLDTDEKMDIHTDEDQPAGRVSGPEGVAEDQEVLV